MTLLRAPSIALLALGLTTFAPSEATAQAPRPVRRPLSPAGAAAAGATPTTPATPTVTPAATPATPAAAAAPPAAATPKGAGVTTAGATPATAAAAGKEGTDKLPQFEQAMGEVQPKNPNYKVSFSLEDADLTELVRVIGQLTGRRFIFGGKVRNIKASVYSPQKVTVAEAYQAFLSILETNGLTVIPHGRFLKIVETGGVASQQTPVIRPNQTAPVEDRFITRLHRLRNVGADEMSTVLTKFKSKEGDISVHGPSNLLIITDTGSNIRRMMSIVDEIDVGGAGDQIWMHPLHYAAASEVAARVNDLFEIKAGAAGAAPAKGAAAPVAGASSSGGEYHVAKVLGDDRTNSVIIVSTERAYLRILELIKRIDVPQSAEGEVRVLPLQHADALELAKTLNEIVQGAAQAGQPPRPGGAAGGAAPPANQGIFEGGVKVSADKSTNSIVVTSSGRDFASLRAVIDRLDKPRRQVFIEAVIMDLSVNRSNQLGVNFHGGSAEDVKGPNDTILYGGLNPIKSATQLTPLQDATLLNGAALGIRGPAIPGTDNLLGTGVSIPAFGMIINALATSGDADVLSTPHILATDNIPAEINIGENIPLNTNVGLPSLGAIPGAAGAAGALGALGGGFGSSFGARQDVGTKIKITPHVNESNQVRLEIQEEISEAKEALPGSAGAVPIVKRTAQTQLVVGDQQTVVIGGLMRNRFVNSEAKVPLLGDIPVLGFLFRSSRREMQKTNLILVLTPSIIRDQADLRRIFERKMQERQEFLDRYFIFREESQFEPPKDYTRTNGLVEAIRQSFFQMDEKKKMDDLLRPKEIKTHQPIQPLDMPGARREPAPGAAAPTPPAANPAPPVNVAPQPRTTVKEVER